jgi:hypothetical protein
MYVWNISFLKAGQSITEVGPNISSFVTKILHISLSQHMKKSNAYLLHYCYFIADVY